MLFEELMKEEYNAGKADALENVLDNARAVLIGSLRETIPVSDNLKNRISSINEIEEIMQLTVTATKVDSLEAFEKELEKMGY